MSLFRPSYLLRRPLALSVSVSLLLTSSQSLGLTNTGSGTLWPIPTNSYLPPLENERPIHVSPYRVTLFNPQNGEDAARTWSQTKSVFLYGLGVVGFLASLPEDFTGWDTDSSEIRWAENVRNGPVWDRDKWYINYIGHTYFGGVYYQVARKSGYRQWDSFVYSFLMSTFYWEYGVEAFAEVPSIQDLVVHPVMGWVYGEWAFQTERRIRAGGNQIAGSKLLGGTALIILDPIDSIARGVNHLSGRTLIKNGSGYFTYTATPTDTTTDHTLYLNMYLPIGNTDHPELGTIRPIRFRRDPVDTGIIGLSIGSGYSALDRKHGMNNGFYSKTTLGLYFTPRFSTRLAYAQGEFDQQSNGPSVTYENYSLDAQYTFRCQKKLRPYATAGIGELMWEKDMDKKTFQWNAGIGLHVRLHRKWALQTDWIHYYSPALNTCDHHVNACLVYRFGFGEHHDW